MLGENASFFSNNSKTKFNTTILADWGKGYQLVFHKN